MADVTVDKGWLVSVVTANRDAHRGVFEEAVEKFRVLALERLDALVKQITAGQIVALHVRLPIPEEHTDDYARALKMLDAHVGTTVELSETAYRCLVEDEWGWHRAFVSNTMAYMNTYPPADT
jgi:hypothetical protein